MAPAMTHPSDPPAGRGLFCNRTMNIRSIAAIGYDMDYTLVHYKVEHWERRAYEYIQRKLDERGWPVGQLSFDPELILRGLVVDKEHGNLLKANRFGYVMRAMHGTKPLPFEKQRQLYGRQFVELSDDRYALLTTLFSLSEGCMYAQLVEQLDAGRLPRSMGYSDLYRQLRASVDEAHMEGELKAEIVAAPERFVELDEQLPLALLDQVHAGKKLLLITNSEWAYSAAMMSFAFDQFLPKTMNWRDLFELVVVAARKPSFFDSRTPALEVVDDAGLLRPHVGSLVAGQCYFGGNAALVEQHLNLSGDEILYVGDHIYSDVVMTKSLLRWRTALIVRELEDELLAVQRLKDTEAQLAELMTDKQRGEWQHYQLRLAAQRQRKRYGPKLSRSQGDMQREMANLREQSEKLDTIIGPLVAEVNRAHNPHWGLLMRAGNDSSLLARQVERYADIYTSRVSNLLWATPFAYLRAARGSLPHDPKQPS